MNQMNLFIKIKVYHWVFTLLIKKNIMLKSVNRFWIVIFSYVSGAVVRVAVLFGWFVNLPLWLRLKYLKYYGIDRLIDWFLLPGNVVEIWSYWIWWAVDFSISKRFAFLVLNEVPWQIWIDGSACTRNSFTLLLLIISFYCCIGGLLYLLQWQKRYSVLFYSRFISICKFEVSEKFTVF